MRSQPGQVSFPGGSLDDGEDAVDGALREAQEETGLDPDGVEVFAVLPRIWLPPRNFAVAPVLAYWHHPEPLGGQRARGARRLPHAGRGPARAGQPLLGPPPAGLERPRLDDRPRPRRAAVGLHRRHPRRALRARRLDPAVGQVGGADACPRSTSTGGAWRASSGSTRPRASGFDAVEGRPRSTRRPRPTSPTATARPVNGLDMPPVVLVLAYAVSGYWQGFVTGAFATGGPAPRRPLRRLGRPRLLGNADPSVLGLARCAVHHAALRLARAGLLQYAGARIRDRITWQPVRALDAVGGAALSVVAVLVVAWALGVAVRGEAALGQQGDPRSEVLGRVNAVMPASAVSCSPASTTSSAPPSSRATSSRSRPSASSGSARRPRASRATPSGAAAAQRAQDPRRQPVRPRASRAPASSTPRPADDQRPRRRRRRRPHGASSTTTRSTPRSSTTTPTSTSRCSRGGHRAGPPDLRPQRRDQGPGRRARLPPGRSVRRPGRADPRRAAPAQPRHLRPRHGHPRGLLGPLADPAGQLRWAARVRRRQGLRRRVRGVGEDEATGYALTADQVAEAAVKGISNDQSVSSGRCA